MIGDDAYDSVEISPSFGECSIIQTESLGLHCHRLRSACKYVLNGRQWEENGYRRQAT